MSLPPQPGQRSPGIPPPPRPPQQPPGYYPQPGWGPRQPPQPPKQGNGLKWLLMTVAVLLVIAITVGLTLFFTRGSGSSGPTSTSTPGGPIASAADTGPVAIITVEPTCTSWRPIQNAVAAAESNGWGQRDPLTAASDWTPDQRAQYDAVGHALRSAADQTVALAKQTPHRAMRELYEQFIAYGRAYADSLASYKTDDDFFSRTNVNLGVRSREYAIPSIMVR